MQKMNYLVTIKHESAAKVARHYLLIMDYENFNHGLQSLRQSLRQSGDRSG
ncbi:MAG: Hypothetical protein AJITA_00828 [Acetilactobacillus jinshanensis]